MAVTGNTESVNTVLSIDTSKSASSMKELREQIKELRNQLVGLDSESQEYADTLVELGEKTHQMKEISEQVRMTNTDFGDTLGNVSNVMAGGIAAVQGMTAGLSLLGVEMGDDNKLTQTLVKSMSLLQSLGSMDKAIKSFKALATVMKSNITVAGGLGKALKALAVSNPFTAILAAITAVVAAGAALITMFRNAADAAEQLKDNAMFDADIKSIKEMGWQLEETTRRMKLAQKGQYEIMEAQQKQLWDNVEALDKRISEYSKRMLSASKKRKQAIQEEIDKLKEQKKEYQDQIDYNTRMRDVLYDEEAAKKAAEEQKKAAEEQKKAAEAAKKAAEDKVAAEKEAYDLALKRLELQKTLAETESQANYEEEKRAAQGNAQALLDIDKKYQEERKKLNEQYYNSAIALAENFRSTRTKDSDIVDINQTIANLNKSLQEGADAWEDYKTENAAANIELAKTKLDAQADLDSLNRRTEAMNREIEITRAHNERYLELVQQKWVLQADLDAEAIRYQQEQLQNSNIGIEEDLEAMKTKHEAEMELLQEQYEQRLIAEEEFQQRKAELEAQYDNESTALLQQHFENEVALDELAVEAKKNETDRKKELQESYMSAISSITGSITAILNEASQAEDVSFEDQKKLKIASTIITTLSSAMEAFQAMANIPYVGPALGAAAAASTIALGMMQVNKIKQTKKGSTGTSAASTGAVTTVQSPAQIVNLNAVNDEIELPDQRVYVLESDITDAQGRVAQVETNSTF